MKKILLLAVAILSFAISMRLSAQGINLVTHSPNPAKANAPVTLHIDGWLPNPCWSLVNVSHSFGWFEINIFLDFNFNGGICSQQIVPFTHNYTLNGLASCDYTVNFYNADTWGLLYSYYLPVEAKCTFTAGTPPPVSQLSVKNLTCTSGTLHCTLPPDADDQCFFRYKPVNSVSWLPSNDGQQGTPNSLNVSNLMPNVQYEFQCRVTCTECDMVYQTPWSSSKYFTTCSGGSYSCSSPYPTTCGGVYSGNNGVFGSNYFNNWSGVGGCSFSDMYGPEVFYQITLTSPGPLTLRLTGLSADLDLMLLADCNNYGLLACSGNGYANSEYIHVPWLNAGTYRIAVDGWQGAVSNYTLSVQCNSYYCPAPTLSQLFTTNVTSNSARLNCNYTSGASAYAWAYRAVGFGSWSSTWTTSTNFTDVNGLAPNTTYEFQVSVYCSGAWTSWSGSQYFTTTGSYLSNDEPCGAVELYPSSYCNQITGNNFGATTSWYPYPPTECNTYNMKDVWFKVQIPYTGKLRILTFPGSMTNAVVAFYKGSCNSLTPGTPTCFDQTNGDEMPDVVINSQPGAWVYIRIWGYGGSTGSFSICAQTWSSLQAGSSEGASTVLDAAGADDREAEVPQNEKPTASEVPADKPLTLFPNPASEQVTIATTLTADTEVFIQIFDMTGKKVADYNTETPSGEFSHTMTLADFTAGMYLVRMKAGEKEWVGKFLKN